MINIQSRLGNHTVIFYGREATCAVEVDPNICRLMQETALLLSNSEGRDKRFHVSIRRNAPALELR